MEHHFILGHCVRMPFLPMGSLPESCKTKGDDYKRFTTKIHIF